MANLVALRSAIRASRANLTASRAARRSTAAGLSAAVLAWAARSSWAFFASAAALRRSAKLVFLDLFISIFYAQGKRLLAQGVDGFRSALITPYSRAWTRPRLKNSRACRDGSLRRSSVRLSDGLRDPWKDVGSDQQNSPPRSSKAEIRLLNAVSAARACSNLPSRSNGH